MKYFGAMVGAMVMVAACNGGSTPSGDVVSDGSGDAGMVLPDVVADAGDVTMPHDVTVVVDMGPPDSPPDSGPTDAGADVPLGPCTTNADCTLLQFCDGTGCGTPGTCAARPVTCVPTHGLACGCNGVTYDDACAARLAGERTAATGACPSDGGVPTDGSLVDAPTVDVPVVDVMADVPSTDVPVDDAVAVDVPTVLDAAVDVTLGGSCVSASDCAPSEYCATAAGAACRAVGTCMPHPTFCPLFCPPSGYCGCDGMNYCNPCFAHRARVNVSHVGPCAM